MKYIVIQEKNSNEEKIILFTETISHCNVAKSFKGQKVISAGFLHFFDNQLKIEGESTSLKIKARQERDYELFQKYFESNQGL